MQICHLNNKSLEGFGHWLARRWGQCQKRLQLATEGLSKCGIEKEELWDQWMDQVSHQTKPSPSMSALPPF